jgi:hypothetical protein
MQCSWVYTEGGSWQGQCMNETSNPSGRCDNHDHGWDGKINLTERRENERRVAEHEPAPTGQGRVVLTEYVIPKLDIMHELASLPQALGPLLKPTALAFLRQDLLERAEAGKAKYGTYLRDNNGRDARMDLYQEICDAIMYAAQMRMEGSKSVGEGFVELLINLGSQLATEIHA